MHIYLSTAVVRDASIAFIVLTVKFVNVVSISLALRRKKPSSYVGLKFVNILVYEQKVLTYSGDFKLIVSITKPNNKKASIAAIRSSE